MGGHAQWTKGSSPTTLGASTGAAVPSPSAAPAALFCTAPPLLLQGHRRHKNAHERRVLDLRRRVADGGAPPRKSGHRAWCCTSIPPQRLHPHNEPSAPQSADLRPLDRRSARHPAIAPGAARCTAIPRAACFEGAARCADSCSTGESKLIGAHKLPHASRIRSTTQPRSLRKRHRGRQ